MKYFLKRAVVGSVFILSVTLIPKISHAQVGDPFSDPDLPIDGGVSLLVAAGVGYGIKKYREEKKKRNEVSL